MHSEIIALLCVAQTTVFKGTGPLGHGIWINGIASEGTVYSPVSGYLPERLHEAPDSRHVKNEAGYISGSHAHIPSELNEAVRPNTVLTEQGRVRFANSRLADIPQRRSQIQFNEPHEIVGLSNVTGIDAGFYHTLVLQADGTVLSFGYSPFGQLGHNDTHHHHRPTIITVLSPPNARTKLIAAGYYHSILVDSENQVWTFGEGSRGQLGIGTDASNLTSKLSPIRVVLKDFDPTGSSNSSSTNSSSTNSSSTNSSSTNSNSESGHSNHTNTSDVLHAPSNHTSDVQHAPAISHIAGGGAHSLVATVDATGAHTLYAFGSNEMGQLGLGDMESHDTIYDFDDIDAEQTTPPIRGIPEKVLQLKREWQFYSVTIPPSEIRQISAGYYHSVVLLKNGHVYTAGDASMAQLGHGEFSNRDFFTRVTGFTDIASVAAGYYHTVLLRSTGQVLTVGAGFHGQLGHGDYINRQWFEEIPNITNVKEIAAGQYHTVLLFQNGSVATFGQGTYGQLGLFDNENRPAPNVIPGLTNISAIAAGYRHTVVLRQGKVLTFGNGYGAASNEDFQVQQ